jgi:hypothetical protein
MNKSLSSWDPYPKDPVDCKNSLEKAMEYNYTKGKPKA